MYHWPYINLDTHWNHETNSSTVHSNLPSILSLQTSQRKIERYLPINSSKMKFFIVLFALAAYAMAEAAPNVEARAGCSMKGQFCVNGGTFRCCEGQGSCIDQRVSLLLRFFWK